MNSTDFHQIFDRKNSGSVKWELTEEIFGERNLLPMWVADMDFPPPKEVTEAIQARVEHGIFGYTFVPQSTGEVIKEWLAKRHDWQINSEWILYSQGVVPAISMAIQAFTRPGDAVMLQAPVYTPFFDMIRRNGRKVVNAPLELRDNRYEINFDVFEEKLREEDVKLFLLCNPHNPGGRVWTKEELSRMGELCQQYNCLILSDEIHSDLVFKPFIHVPIASLSDTFSNNVITCIAPSKTFNIAGLQASALIIPNETLRKRFKGIMLQNGFYSLNTFGIVAMEAAYKHGEKWLEELLSYLAENKQIASRFIAEQIPEIVVVEPEGTYLIWLDCRKLGLSDKELKERLLKKGKLALEPGLKYGSEGSGFVRMNIACPQEILLDGLARLKTAFS